MNAITQQLADALRAMEKHTAYVCDGYPPTTMSNAWKPARRLAREALAAYDAHRAQPAAPTEEHTAEPWRVGSPDENREAFGGGVEDALIVGPGDVCPAITNGNGSGIALVNARRIVACVNFCAGIPTATLEAAQGEFQ